MNSIIRISWTNVSFYIKHDADDNFVFQQLSSRAHYGRNTVQLPQRKIIYFHFYSARNARIASAVLATAIPSVRPSVRPSVCLFVCLSVGHTPVLCQNDGT